MSAPLAPPDGSPPRSVSVDEAPGPAAPGKTARALGLVLGGVGIVGIGVGVGIALDAKSKDNQAANESGTARQTDSENAVSQGNVATVVLGVGAAVAVAGVVLWLTAPRAQSGSATAAGSVGSFGVGMSGRGVIFRGSF